MNPVATVLALALIAVPNVVTSQTPAKARESGIYLTIFRSPSTGVEVRSGHGAANLGFYPAVLSRDGKRDNVSVVRLGGSYYMRDRGSGFYVSPSIVFSLDKSWKQGALKLGRGR